MPRNIRIEYPGAIYHAMCRGNNGQETFINDDGRRLFLSTLTEACAQTGWQVHAYVLMSNHYHLLLETPEANLVEGMRWFQSAYTQRFNSMFKRRGHLFQGRYKALPVQTDPRHGGLEYFRQISSYIHLNPFRAKLYGEGFVHSLESYPWSSYPAYIGKDRGKRPEWLVRSKVLGTLGLQEGKPGYLKGYQHHIERMMKFENDPDAGRRGEFEKQVEHGWFLGSERYREYLDTFLKGRTKNDNYRGSQRRDHDLAEAEALLAEGLKRLGITEEEILESKSVRLEKQALVWLIKSHTTVRGNWLAERLQMGHPVNVSRALTRFRSKTDHEANQMKERMIRCLG
jgi:REP element-mobilizing transposase RayT